jgi:hypothetical protein
MTTRSMTFSLRLPLSLKTAVEKLAKADGASMNQFLVMAAAEKIASIQTAESFLAARKGRGDKAAALAFLRDGGGEDPRKDDRLPSSIAPPTER